ncbi:hypothetical protein GCM10010293_47350 [Streptomyces griseoflavus]|nr:hypothetical protein GCM10010293_47350 [Streptomyces griseoflavus]
MHEWTNPLTLKVTQKPYPLTFRDRGLAPRGEEEREFRGEEPTTMKTAVPCYYHLDVEVSPEKVGQVSRIMAAHLRFWDLENLMEPVCGGAEMLLRAIAEHATDRNTSIEMWWNGQHLITAIGENNRALRPDQELRGCLQHIAACSDGWGCCATESGAKVIWFSQRARAGERVPLVPTTPDPRESEGLDLPRELSVTLLTGRVRTPGGLLEEAR